MIRFRKGIRKRIREGSDRFTGISIHKGTREGFRNGRGRCTSHGCTTDVLRAPVYRGLQNTLFSITSGSTAVGAVLLRSGAFERISLD